MHKQAIPVALRMAMGVASNEMLRRHHGRRIGALEEEAEIINALARRDELERQASTIAAMRYSRAPIVLGPGGTHPSFGYRVPVGDDRGMVRTAAEEIGRRMARKEAAFRKQSLSLGTKVGLGATAGMVGLGGLGIAADKGMRVADKYVARSQWAGQPLQQAKLGAALVCLHEGMDKEALGLLSSGAAALKSGWRGFGRAFKTSRGTGANPFAAASFAGGRGGQAAKGTFRKVREMPSAPVPKIEPPRPGTGGYAPRAQQPAAPARGTAQAGPAPAAAAPAAAAPAAAAPVAAPTPTAGGFGEGVKRWGNKWVAGPAKFMAKHPGLTAAGAIGVPAVAYGGYRAATAATDVMQQHNPQYTYNTGGYQLPTNVNEYGYTQAPGLRY